MSHIHHIATEAEWAARDDTYAPVGWREEGFIHCSTAEQLVRTANKHFPGRRDLILLTIDTSLLTPLLVWEDTSGSGEDFPHIYGSIDTVAVTSAVPFHPGEGGTFDGWTHET